VGDQVIDWFNFAIARVKDEDVTVPPSAWVAEIVRGKFPASVGVPEISPVEVLRASPIGRVPDATAKVTVPEVN
jgi:hypothetical protein